MTLCPNESHAGVILINQRGQDAVTALGIYVLESNLQHLDLILAYLLKLLRALPKAIWTDERPLTSSDSKFLPFQRQFFLRFIYITGVPVAERFSFLLTTLLSDIAVRCEENRDRIIATQIESLSVLTSAICSILKDKDQLNNLNSKGLYKKYCRLTSKCELFCSFILPRSCTCSFRTSQSYWTVIRR